jgi:hypothetical protein
MFFWIDLAIDVYFAFDLCLNIRTAVLTPEGELMFAPWSAPPPWSDHLYIKKLMY